MLQLDAVVIDAWLAKHQVVRTYLVGLHGIFAAIEPHQVHDACTVREMSHHALLAGPHLEGLETQDVPHHLHKRHIARQLVYGIDLRAVHIFVGIILQQVTKCLDAKFLTQQLLPVGAYARQVFDVLIEYVHSDKRFCYFEVEGCGDFDILTVAVDDRHFVTKGLYY